MTPPLTLGPNCWQESVAASASSWPQIFGEMHFTLSGLVDSMMPSSGPWVVLGTPILWWALPSGPGGSACKFSGAPPTGWISLCQPLHPKCMHAIKQEMPGPVVWALPLPTNFISAPVLPAVIASIDICTGSGPGLGDQMSLCKAVGPEGYWGCASMITCTLP
ncbi:hypothetical protein DSO57_1038331 [Entomophthora muscae]|uniref:Uncharacterized protein n=1 Tax=Entomophthora muscae TaxID=34485 RepID=A0ACC2U820_9FUNG|nr:hypothetical protein DSO57_1038331 [Entomophthora muscae]